MANRMILNETAWFGRGAVGALTDEVKRRGYQKALIVTDKTLVQCGVVAKVTDKMDAAGLAWAIYDGVVPNPTITVVKEGLGIFYFLCAFLPIYFGAEHAKTIIDVLPQRLIDGLGVAGGIMPAIGFAVLLKIMMKNVYIPYFILGFVAAAWLKLPVLAIAAAALAMALIDLLRKSPEPTQPAAQKEEFEDGI